ncbi:hypothetical protein KAW08_00860 [bacterium]|nr:hypothetical protein [bacterium]
MGSAIKILFFLIFFGVWIIKIAKKFSEMKNTQSQAAYRPQRKERIPQSAEESFPELDFEKEQETHQTPEEPVYEAEQDAVRGFLKELNLVKEEESQESEDYIQPELVEDEVEEIPEEEFKKPITLANDSWKSEEVISTLSIGASDARTGIIMSEILGKPIALR